MRKIGIFAVLFLSSLSVLSAQDSSTRLFRLAVHYAGPQADRVLPALSATLLKQIPSLSVLASNLTPDSSREDQLGEASRSAVDVVLNVSIQAQGNQWKVQWNLRSPFESASKVRAKGQLSKSAPNWSDAAEIFWLFLLDPVEKALADKGHEFPYPPVVNKGTLKVKARPGTVVEGLAKGGVKVGEAGFAEAIVNIPGTFVLSGESSGYLTSEVKVFVDRNDQVVDLPQSAIKPFALDGYLFNLAFPSTSFQWNFWPGTSFARASLDQFWGGLGFQPAQNGMFRWPFISEDLFVLKAGAGWYWSRPEGVRFYTAADVGVRFLFADFKVFAVEPVHPLEFQLFAGWEVPLNELGSVFFEVGPTIFLTTDLNESLASRPQNDNSAYLDLPGNLILELPLSAKLGYRWFF